MTCALGFGVVKTVLTGYCAALAFVPFGLGLLLLPWPVALEGAVAIVALAVIGALRGGS